MEVVVLVLVIAAAWVIWYDTEDYITNRLLNANGSFTRLILLLRMERVQNYGMIKLTRPVLGKDRYGTAKKNLSNQNKTTALNTLTPTDVIWVQL